MLRDESNASGNQTAVIFAGGTSVREYNGTTITGNVSPVVEFIRGSDWGGGVGGILYSLRSGSPSYYHYDGRGDVVAQAGSNRSLTYQAAYEAFGKHDGTTPGTEQYGSSLDRQRANTKEEDPDGIIDEGERFLDFNTGGFLSKDPLGMVDGPNLYTYVNQNPWTKFDPEGLFAGTPLDAGEWFSAVGSGAAGGLYDNTVGAAVQGYHSGEQHMEGGFSEIANAHSALDVTIGTLGIVAATGDATGAVMAVTPEGKVEKVAAEGAEKLVAKEGEQAVAKTVEQKTEATVSSSAKADAQKAAATTDKATDKTYQTYTKTNPETGEVYTGRTSGTGTPEANVKARDAGHHMNDKGYGPAQLDKSSSNPDAIRGSEQQQIEANGGAKKSGGTSGNQINGVSPSNAKADQYKDAANKEFGGN